jgi:hypothetical protein
MSDANDFWQDYEGFRWESVSDVEKFVTDAVERETYIEGFLQFDYGSDWIENWWYRVQSSIKFMIGNFSSDELMKSVEVLLEPMDSDAGDCAIMDSLICGGVDFSNPRLKGYFDNYYQNWCEDSYVSWPWDNIQFSYCAYESIALAPTTSTDVLGKVFKDSFVMQESHVVFRIRVALAKNPSTPPEILRFLFDNRSTMDWLISDPDSYIGGDSPLLDDYRINEKYDNLENMRMATQALLDDGLANEATYMISILDLDWDPGSAAEALLCAFAHNERLSPEIYSALFESGYESVIYFLSKNAAVDGALRANLESLKPTFTLMYAGGGFRDTLT